MKHTQEELQAIVEIPLVEKAIDRLIQAEIETYNKANGTKYTHINAMQKYTRNINYTHYAFAMSVLDWNELVWETSRQMQIDIFTGAIAKPESVEAFIALLPTRV